MSQFEPTAEELLAMEKAQAIMHVRSKLGCSLREAFTFYVREPRTWIQRLEQLGQPAPGTYVGPEEKIRQVIRRYHLALDLREHGGTATAKALDEIQEILNMCWIQGQELAKQQGAAS